MCDHWKGVWVSALISRMYGGQRGVAIGPYVTSLLVSTSLECRRGLRSLNVPVAPGSNPCW